MHRPCRGPQWSLRSMLIATAIVALVLGAFMARLRVQWAALRAQRAKVTQLECHADSEVQLNLGIFPNIERLDLTGRKLTDAGLSETAMRYQRGELPHLQTLVIFNAGVTDEGMKAIRTMTGLTMLAIRNTPITDRGLEPIQNLRNLETFSVSNSDLEPWDFHPSPSDAHITHQGLEYLSKLPRLRDVDLVCISIGHAELKALESLPEGCRLNVVWTNAPIDGLRAFQAKRPDMKVQTHGDL